jgi:hypothetical protein
MPIMALFRSPRIDPALYDAIMQELDLERRDAPGPLVHTCGFDDHGICVVDVWESRKDFDAFLSNRLQPAFAKLNVQVDPPVVLDTYAFTVTEGVDRYKPQLAPT